MQPRRQSPVERVSCASGAATAKRWHCCGQYDGHWLCATASGAEASGPRPATENDDDHDAGIVLMAHQQ